MKSKGRFAAAGISGLFAGVLILLLRLVDVRAIGPEGTSIGLSHLNQYVFQFFGVNILFYSITDWLGIAAILTAALFASVGFVQMIRRRSVLKVDREILALGGLYILVIGLYVLFEVMIVNYRPIIMPGCTRPETSFPSSHTMLICVIMGSTMMLIDRYVKGKAASGVLRAGCAAVIGITVIGRLISGVHWFTDIVGGILISAMLLNLYAGVLQKISKEHGREDDT